MLQKALDLLGGSVSSSKPLRRARQMDPNGHTPTSLDRHSAAGQLQDPVLSRSTEPHRDALLYDRLHRVGVGTDNP